MGCGPSLSSVRVVIGSRLGEAENESNSPAWHRYKFIWLAEAKHRSSSPAKARCNKPTTWAHDPKPETTKCRLTKQAQRRRDRNRPARKKSRARRSLERMVRRRGPHKIQAFENNRLWSESVKRVCRHRQSTWRSRKSIELTSMASILMHIGRRSQTSIKLTSTGPMQQPHHLGARSKT